MKKYIKNNVYVIDVEVTAYHPLFSFMEDIAASRDLSKYEIPTGPVIAKDKKRITDRMEIEFESCMITVEDFCQENLGLIGTYKNVSQDNSYYYNYLATDEDHNIIIDYRMRLRISNHPASSTPEQRQHKKNEEKSPKLNDLLTYEQIKKLRKYYVNIIVNDETFDTWGKAINGILDDIEAAVEVMKSNIKYRKKVQVPDRYKGSKGFEAIVDDSAENNKEE